MAFRRMPQPPRLKSYLVMGVTVTAILWACHAKAADNTFWTQYQAAIAKARQVLAQNPQASTHDPNRDILIVLSEQVNIDRISLDDAIKLAVKACLDTITQHSENKVISCAGAVTMIQPAQKKVEFDESVIQAYVVNDWDKKTGRQEGKGGLPAQE
jgi:hypothetical protein